MTSSWDRQAWRPYIVHVRKLMTHKRRHTCWRWRMASTAFGAATAPSNAWRLVRKLLIQQARLWRYAASLWGCASRRYGEGDNEDARISQSTPCGPLVRCATAQAGY